ncbi:MAG: isochorismate synthase [Chloroflexota bacterium]
MTLAEARPGTGFAGLLGDRRSGRGVATAAVAVPRLDPVALAGAALDAGLETAAWLRPSDGLAMVGIGRAWATEPAGDDRFRAAEAAWTELMTGPVMDPAGPERDAGAGPVLLGGLGFLGERAADRGPWAPFPVASLVLPSLLYRERAGGASLTVAVAPGEDPERLESTWASLVRAAATRVRVAGRRGRPTGVRSVPDAPGWARLVGLMSGAVGRGRLDKVVLARRVDLELGAAADPSVVLGALAAGAPESAAFLFARGGRVFLGATPERLARVEGQAFRTVAIAGSTRRGRDAAEDAALAAALLASDKDREEHAIVVDELRARLAPLASDLRVAPGPGVLALRDLQHLVTPVEGVLRERAGILTLAGLLHPTPAVGGAPADAALAMIAEHEGFDRGWYAGPVGWAGADGDGELMVALRSGVLDGARASLFAGCGIVADSDPGREWAESRMKLRPMLAALGLDPDDTEAVA